MGIYTLTAPRIYFAMANDGLFFRRVAEVHPRFQTPAFAIVAQSLWAVVLILFWGTFENLISYVVFTDWIFFGLAAAAVFVFRRRRPDAERCAACRSTRSRPCSSSAMSAWFVAVTLVQRPAQAWAGLAFLALGVPGLFLLEAPESPGDAAERATSATHAEMPSSARCVKRSSTATARPRPAWSSELLAAGTPAGVGRSENAWSPAMDEAGRRFEPGEFFVPELLVAARAMKSAMGLLDPRWPEQPRAPPAASRSARCRATCTTSARTWSRRMLRGTGFEVRGPRRRTSARTLRGRRPGRARRSSASRRC